MLECEATRLRHAAKNAKNFVEWLDEFYIGNGFGSKFHELSSSILDASVRACYTVGMDASYTKLSIADYGKKRHAMILNACSEVTKEQLPNAIEKLINSEPELIAQGILATSLGGIDGTEN